MAPALSASSPPPADLFLLCGRTRWHQPDRTPASITSSPARTRVAFLPNHKHPDTFHQRSWWNLPSHSWSNSRGGHTLGGSVFHVHLSSPERAHSSTGFSQLVSWVENNNNKKNPTTHKLICMNLENKY